MTAWFSPGWHTLTPFWKHRTGINHYRQCSAQDKRGTCTPELAAGDGKCPVHLSPLLPLHETSNWTRPSQPWGSPVFTGLSSSAWQTFPSYCEVKKETLTRVMCCWDGQPCTTWNGDNSHKCSLSSCIALEQSQGQQQKGLELTGSGTDRQIANIHTSSQI